MSQIQIKQEIMTGGLWFAAWLFSIGFVKLTFWQGVMAVVIWPYYMGAHFAAVPQ